MTTTLRRRPSAATAPLPTLRVLAAADCRNSKRAPSPAHPNVPLLVLDTGRADCCPLLGDTRSTADAS